MSVSVAPPRLKPNPLPPYKVLYDIPEGTWLIVNMGGRGGGKSYETSKFATIMAIQKQLRVAILRDQQSTIDQSILNEIKLRFNEIDEKSYGFYSQHFDMQARGLKNKKTQTDLIFTKGFQTSTVSQKANLKSISDVDIAIIEEFEDIRDEQKFNTFADSIRKEGSVIVVNLNTPDKNHWFIKRFFTLDDTDYEGYFKAVPKPIKGVVFTFTTFEDNPHLPKKVIEKYRAYGDHNNELFDLDYYCSAILGLVSEGKKGRIYRNWKPISLAEFQQLPYPSFAGLDFGYSDDPVAIVELKKHNKNVWIRVICYKTELSDEQIAQIIKDNLPKGCPVYADSAEPKSISKLKQLGNNVIAASKGPDSIKAGIKAVKYYNVHYVYNRDLEDEYTEYCWAVDANKNLITPPRPIDAKNHIMDAIRYPIFTREHLKKLQTA